MLQITKEAVHKILDGEFTAEDIQEMNYNEEYRPVYNGVVLETGFDDNGKLTDLELSWKEWHWEKATLSAKDMAGKSDQEIADILNLIFRFRGDIIDGDFYPASLKSDWKNGLPKAEDAELPF